MSENKTSFPHQDLIAENKIVVTELPKKTQDLIAKFATLTDADSQDAMDEKLYGQIEDFMEEKAKADKAAQVKAKVEAHKEKKKAATPAAGADVSKAETAAGTAGAPAGKKEEKKEEAPKSALGFLFGKK